MKVLVICDQYDLVAPLREQLRQRIEPIVQVPVNWQAIGESVDLKQLLQQQAPDYVICSVVLGVDASKEEYDRYEKILHLVVPYVKKQSTPLIFLSTAAVFSDGKISYSEQDECSPQTDMARFYCRQENFVSEQLKHFIILRSSWLYSNRQDNFLASVINYASNDRLISLNSAGKGCPTSVHDIARVLIAILLQLSEGADCWGVYHYASSDAAIGFQFIEAIVAQAQQFDANIDARNLRFEHDDRVAGVFYFEPVVLSCGKLLNAFGIHQKPWRSMLAEVVKEHFDETGE